MSEDSADINNLDIEFEALMMISETLYEMHETIMEIRETIREQFDKLYFSIDTLSEKIFEIVDGIRTSTNEVFGEEESEEETEGDDITGAIAASGGNPMIAVLLVVLKPLISFLKKIMAILQLLNPAKKGFAPLDELFETFADLIDLGFVDLWAEMYEMLAPYVGMFADIMAELSPLMLELFTTIGLLDLLKFLMDGFMALLRLIIPAITILIAIINGFVEWLPTAGEWIVNLWETIKTVVGNIVNAVLAVRDKILEILAWITNGIASIVGSVVGFFQSIPTFLSDLWDDIQDFFRSLPGDVKDALDNALVQPIKEQIEKVKTFLTNTFDPKRIFGDMDTKIKETIKGWF